MLLLEPIDLYLRYRPLLSGRLFGPGKELDDLLFATQDPTAARGTQESRTGEPRAAEPEEIVAGYRPRHLPFTRPPCPQVL